MFQLKKQTNDVSPEGSRMNAGRHKVTKKVTISEAAIKSQRKLEMLVLVSDHKGCHVTIQSPFCNKAAKHNLKSDTVER